MTDFEACKFKCHGYIIGLQLNLIGILYPQMNQPSSPLFLLLFTLLCAWTNASAFNSAPSVDISETELILLDKGQLRFYRDKTNTLTLEQVRSETIQQEFRQLEKNLGLGYVPDSVWLTFTIDKQEAQAALWWLEVLPSYLDDIQLFHIEPTGKVTISQGGGNTPYSQKQEAYRGTVFKLEELQLGHHEFYLRIKTTGTMTAVIKLWQPDTFASQMRDSYFLFGLYFSLIFTVFLFTVINWLLIKEKIFLYYSLYLLLNAIQWLAIHGFVGEFIFPEQPINTRLTLGISLSLAATMAYVFYGKIYELKRYHPWIYIVYVIAALSALATAISVPFGLYKVFAPVLLIMAIIATLTSPWPLLRFWRSKKTWMRITIVAYAAFSVLNCINILSSLSVLSFSEATLYAGMLSNLCHIFLLHYAITYQFRDKAEVTRQALARVENEKKRGQEQSQFLAMMTHEIRTPIAVIDAANESLRMLSENDDNEGEQKQRRFDRISRSVKRLNTMLEMALINTKHESWPLESRTLKVAELTRDVLGMLDSNAEKRVKLLNNEQHLTVTADRRILRIAMLNIIDNALKYGPLSSIITIKMYRSNYQNTNGIGWIVFNEGDGIPDDMINKIFNKYQRGDESSTQSGLGLGLYLVKNVIERHQGHVVIKNKPEEGVEIGFWLPVDNIMDHMTQPDNP